MTKCPDEPLTPGDEVEYIGPRMAALPGATGIIGPKGTFKQWGETYVEIIWHDTPLRNYQMHGGYSAQHFKKLAKASKQPT